MAERKPRSGGPKLKLRQAARRNMFLDFLRSGMSKGDAAILADVSDDTVQRHEKRSRAFREAVRKATIEGKFVCVATFRKAAAVDWKAAAEFLARKYPEEWSKHRVMRIQIDDKHIDDVIAEAMRELAPRGQAPVAGASEADADPPNDPAAGDDERGASGDAGGDADHGSAPPAE